MVKGKYLNFILSGIRHAKSQMITVALLFLVASALINTFLFLSFDYTQNFNREKERLNGEDIDFLYTDTAANEQGKEALSQILSGIDGIRQFEIEDVTCGNGSVEFKGALLSNNLTFLDYDDAWNKQIGRYEIIESDGGSGVYLSYLFKVDGGYSVGQTISVRIGNYEESFRIAGFYNNVDTGTMNCTDIAFLITDDCPNGFHSPGVNSYRISVLLDDTGKSDMMESVIAEEIADGLPTMFLNGSSSVNKLASSRYVTATIFKAIICLGALLMIGVVLTVISITLSNYIRNNKKSLGTLKALGYTSNNLITPIVIEFSVIGLMMSLFGAGFSYLLFPMLNTAMEKQVGIPYDVRFLPAATVLSVGICVVLAASTSYLSVVKIRSIAPINAIRENRTGRSGRHHFFALDKTCLGLNTALSLKTWISATARNLVIFFSMTGVAFLIGFACFSYQNVILDQQDILNLVCGQMTDSVVGVYSPFEDSLCEKLENDPEIERCYMFSVSTVTPKDLPKMYSYITDSMECIDEERICIKGKLPASDSEIAVNGTYAANNALKTGDTLTFESNGNSATFVVSGIVQGAYMSGRDCYITRSGYSKISPLQNVSYYIDLKDGADIDTFNERIGKECDILYCNNYRKSVETVSLTYIQILTMSTAIIVVLSFIVAGFILYILVSIFLSNKKREHGILKSLGFVTGDIIYQTVLSIMPTCVIATVLGLWLSRNGVAKLLALALNGIGIFSFGTPTKAIFLLTAGFVIVGFTALYTTLLSNSVRKITPHKLFNNE